MPITLKVIADKNIGNVDWLMTFPDDSIGNAYSRVTPLSQGVSLYSFILTPPPVPLEELEGALEQQASILEKELDKLKGLLEK